MAARDRLVVKGYREFLRATDRAETKSKRFVRDEFRQIGELVRKPAAEDLKDLQESGISAAGLRTVVRRRGVTVEQSLRRVDGSRPDWGATQMRKILIPNLEDKEREIERKAESALNKIADHFDR